MASEANGFPRSSIPMYVRLYQVTQWRGINAGWRKFGGEKSLKEALRMARLVERIFPEYTSAQVTPTRD